MRNMSFFLTTRQMRNRTKTVTRRLGWLFLTTNEVIQAVEKCQGLRRGEKVVKLTLIRALDIRREPLCDITAEDCVLEGFPQMTPLEFVGMFCRHNKCEPSETVTRIGFEYVEDEVTP